VSRSFLCSRQTVLSGAPRAPNAEPFHVPAQSMPLYCAPSRNFGQGGSANVGAALDRLKRAAESSRLVDQEGAEVADGRHGPAGGHPNTPLPPVRHMARQSSRVQSAGSLPPSTPTPSTNRTRPIAFSAFSQPPSGAFPTTPFSDLLRELHGAGHPWFLSHCSRHNQALSA
jgi:hypothetical protein